MFTNAASEQIIYAWVSQESYDNTKVKNYKHHEIESTSWGAEAVYLRMASSIRSLSLVGNDSNKTPFL